MGRLSIRPLPSMRYTLPERSADACLLIDEEEDMDGLCEEVEYIDAILYGGG